MVLLAAVIEGSPVDPALAREVRSATHRERATVASPRRERATRPGARADSSRPQVREALVTNALFVPHAVQASLAGVVPLLRAGGAASAGLPADADGDVEAGGLTGSLRRVAAVACGLRVRVVGSDAWRSRFRFRPPLASHAASVRAEVGTLTSATTRSCVKPWRLWPA